MGTDSISWEKITDETRCRDSSRAKLLPSLLVEWLAESLALTESCKEV
jgi:hypothetical protein